MLANRSVAWSPDGAGQPPALNNIKKKKKTQQNGPWRLMKQVPPLFSVSSNVCVKWLKFVELTTEYKPNYGKYKLCWVFVEIVECRMTANKHSSHPICIEHSCSALALQPILNYIF